MRKVQKDTVDFSRRKFVASAALGSLVLSYKNKAVAQSSSSSSSNWQSIADTSLEVASGSILDFSALVDAGPAGKHGWARSSKDGRVNFENAEKPQVFFSASFQFSPSSGGFPSKGDAVKLVAQLRFTGYNAVRFQCVDANLMSGREMDFDYSLEQLDRFHFFLAKLKEAGIYVVSDLAYNDNAAFGGVKPHRWVKKYSFRRDLYFSEEAKNHWKRLVTSIFGLVNPYTGLPTIRDPGLLCVVLSNEGGVIELLFREGGGWNAIVPDVYRLGFREWLRGRYKNSDVWRENWGREALSSESLEGTVALPIKIRGSTPRHTDFMRFVVDLEKTTYDWMSDHVRKLGFEGLVTSYNNWSWLHSDLTRAHAQVVDMHAYHAHPTGFVEPGSTVVNESSLPRAASYLRSLATTRQWKKPFLVTEYGHAFWNGFRREASALVPAYAALQQWDLLTQFSENSLQLTYRGNLPSRLSAIFPFTISTDPIRRSGERLAALLYARGDVAPAVRRIEFRIKSDEVLSRNGGWSQPNELASRMALITGIGLGIDVQGNSANHSLLTDPNDFMVDKTRLGYQVFAGIGNTLRRKLSSEGVMDERAWSMFDSGRYVSDTGEIDFNSADSRFVINTPRTVVLLTQSSSDRVGVLSVTGLSTPALVAASSMDSEPLTKSHRVLLFLLTDATNTDIEFDDAARTRLRKLGTLPARIQTVQLQLQLGLTTARLFQLYALSQNGRRVQTIPVETIKAGLWIKIDTAALENGPSTMFELVAE